MEHLGFPNVAAIVVRLMVTSQYLYSPCQVYAAPGEASTINILLHPED